MIRRIGVALLSTVLVIGVLSGTSFGQQWRDHKLRLRVGDKVWTYNTDQLKALATKEVVSNRGSKKAAAISVEVLLTKDPKLTMDRVIGVIFVGETDVLLIEGNNLALLKTLVLKVGPNELTLRPEVETEETVSALMPLMGKPRPGNVERVDVLERRG